MPDPQTPNLGLYVPLNGADVNTWDVPMNANFNALDAALGQVSNVALTNVNVVLSAAQYACMYINFTGTLSGNVSIQFPTFQRIWVVRNGCSANTSFTVNVIQNVVGRVPCLPPNETVMVAGDGTNMDIMGLGRVGSYLDIGATTVPLWISGSTPQPYLNCDGTSFSSAAYPALRDYLGTTTLPDARGRFRAALDQATGRLTGSSSLNGLNGSTLLAGGGSQTIGQTNIPSYNIPVTDPTHFHTAVGGIFFLETAGAANTAAFGSDFGVFAETTAANTASATTGITAVSGGSGSAYAPPAYVGGLTLIRAG